MLLLHGMTLPWTATRPICTCLACSGSTALLVTPITLVCVPAPMLKPKGMPAGWSAVAGAQAELMRQRKAFRRYIYLDVSGACWLLFCGNARAVACVAGCLSANLLQAIPKASSHWCRLAGAKAQLKVTEAVECQLPPHPSHLPLDELAARTVGHWRPPKPN